MFSLRALFIFCYILFVTSVNAQPGKAEVAVGFTEKIKSSVYEKDIEIFISLPAGYENSGKSYPVFYGIHSNHLLSAVITATLRMGSIPPSIYVHIIDYNSGDFLPTPATGQSDTGNAERLKKFFREELIPHVNRNYRTENFRVIQASAWGGVFCLYTLMTEPELFNAYLATNPWFIYDSENKYILNLASDCFNNQNLKNRFLFMSAGNDNDPGLRESFIEFDSLLNKIKPAGLNYKSATWPEEDHQSVIHVSTWRGLKWVFEKATNVPHHVVDKGLDALADYESDLKNLYGYEIKLNTSQIWVYGWELMSGKNFEKAAAVFKIFCELNPKAHYGPMGVAKAYEAEGNYELALKEFKKARKIADEIKLKDANRYLPDIERVKKKIRRLIKIGTKILFINKRIV